MNKREFTRYVNNGLKALSLEKQIKVLEKMQGWVIDLLHTKQKKAGTWIEPNERIKYVYCEECKTYYLKEKVKSEYRNETRVVTTYSDCGYGDDDRLGEVEESVEYKTCPRCGYLKEVSRCRVKIIKEWTRL